MSDKGNACGNCRFYREPVCCANPPLGHAEVIPEQNKLTGKIEARTMTIGYWPYVRTNQWCGKHEPMPPSENN